MTASVRILGIETSCDETAAAVVADGRRVLSSRVASQVPLHQRYGGVVPEVASRAHLEAILPQVEGALADAGTTLAEIDGIAVTRGPGLIGCLLIGMEAAKAMASATGKPLVSVHHIAGHLHSPFLGREADAWGSAVEGTAETYPFIGMVVSGGHSSIVLVRAPLDFEVLGETLDDAAGEAYDKVAKMLGLGYPGGPVIDRVSEGANASAFDFPRPLLDQPGFDFSFSGLKTSVGRAIEKCGGAEALRGDEGRVRDLAASFQAAAVEVMVERARKALKKHRLRRLAVAGGVACNRALRRALRERLEGIAIGIPSPEYCTDNAAMIAGLGHHVLASGARTAAEANADSSLPLDRVSAWQG